MIHAPAGKVNWPATSSSQTDRRHGPYSPAPDRLSAAVLPDRSGLCHLLRDGPVVYSHKPDAPFTVAYVSESARRRTGYGPERFVEQVGLWVEHLHPTTGRGCSKCCIASPVLAFTGMSTGSSTPMGGTDAARRIQPGRGQGRGATGDHWLLARHHVATGCAAGPGSTREVAAKRDRHKPERGLRCRS